MDSFVCAVADRSGICERLRTYTHTSQQSPAENCTIWEAGRATSAAPFYFPPMEINGQRYFDGGMVSNNPILEVVNEARLRYGETAEFRTVLSIGTGAADPSSMGQGIRRFFKKLVEQVTSTEKMHRECQ